MQPVITDDDLTRGMKLMEVQKKILKALQPLEPAKRWAVLQAVTLVIRADDAE